MNWLFRFRESIRTWGCTRVHCSNFAEHILTWSSYSFQGFVVCLKESWYSLDSVNLPKYSQSISLIAGIMKDNHWKPSYIHPVYPHIFFTFQGFWTPPWYPCLPKPFNSLRFGDFWLKPILRSCLGVHLLIVERCWKTRRIGILPLLTHWHTKILPVSVSFGALPPRPFHPSRIHIDQGEVPSKDSGFFTLRGRSFHFPSIILSMEVVLS